MTIAMIVDNPQGSQETYEKVRKEAGLDSPGGGILHVAGPSPNGGWRVIELFESEDEAKRFIEQRVAPAFQAVGAPPPPPPEFWPVHHYMR